MRLSTFGSLLAKTGANFSADKLTMHASSLAYYTIFSLAPLLVIVIAIAAFVFDREGVTHSIADQLRSTIGHGSAEAVEGMLQSATKPSTGILATLLGTAALLFGATGAFAQLQDSLNTIWRVEPRAGNGILAFLRKRLLSFTMVLGTGFLLIVSLGISALLQAFGEQLDRVFPGLGILGQIITALVSFGVITLLFAMIFKILPDAQIGWRHVWIGAAFTAFLFTLGKQLLALYLGSVATSTSYRKSVTSCETGG